MAYSPKFPIIFTKENLDAFGRIKVSNSFTLLDFKQTTPSYSLQVYDLELSGSNTFSTYDQNRAKTQIGTLTGSAGNRIFETIGRGNYQPGKGLSIEMTAAQFQPVTDSTKRVGYFNDSNGIFFESSGGTFKLVLRANNTGTPVDSVIEQSAWNIDKLDGTGASGITLDPQQINIYAFDLEWLGGGSIWASIFINGEEIIVHRIDNANINDQVTFSTPVLPCRWEIDSLSSAPTSRLDCVCANIHVDGGTELARSGILRNIERENYELGAGTAFANIPLISFRLASGYDYLEAIPLTTEVMLTSNANAFFGLAVNPTIGGTDQASWVTFPGSAIQYDVSRDTTNLLTLTDANKAFGTYVTTSGDLSRTGLDELFIFSRNPSTGLSREYVLFIRPFTNNEAASCTINFRELT